MYNKILPARDDQLNFTVYTFDHFAGSTEQPLDPLHLALIIELQRKAENEFVQFVYKLLEHASKMNLNFKYENPISKQCDMSAAEALHGPALDFRWQLKHLEYNRTLFCREVFKQKITEPEFIRCIRKLREKADKQPSDLSMEDVEDMLYEMAQFTEKILFCVNDIQVSLWMKINVI